VIFFVEPVEKPTYNKTSRCFAIATDDHPFSRRQMAISCHWFRRTSIPRSGWRYFDRRVKGPEAEMISSIVKEPMPGAISPLPTLIDRHVAA
jgi:hypothetical protein